MMLFKRERRSPGDERLKAAKAAKAVMQAIPDAVFADLAAYFASRR